MSDPVRFDIDDGEDDDILAVAHQEPDDGRKGKKKPEAKSMEQSLVKTIKENVQTKKSVRSEGEIREHQSLASKIRKYLNNPRFRDYLAENDFSYTPRQLRDMSTDELREIYQRIKCCIDDRNPAEILTTAHHVVVGVLESASQRPPLNKYADLTGLSAIASQDDDLLDALACLEIEYGMGSSMSPEQRYALSMIRLAMMVRTQNAMRQQLEQAQAQMQAQAQIPVQSEEPEMKGYPPGIDDPGSPPPSPVVPTFSMSDLRREVSDEEPSPGIGLGLESHA